MIPSFYDLLRETLTHLAMFLVLLYVLKLYLWGPFLKMMDERNESIQGEYDKAEELQEKYSKLQQDYEDRLKAIEDEARKKVNEAVAEGNRLRDDILAKANEEARVLREKSEKDIEQQIVKARVELKEEIVRLTLYATGKLINEKLDADKHNKLVGDFITQYDSQK